MEEQKYQKKKKKALNGSNKKYLAEACTELADFYNKKGSYEAALNEYKESAKIYSDIGMKLENARSNRMVGEMYMFLGEFKKALKYEDLYLNIARELNNRIEEQRALATLGRAFLLQGQSLSESEASKSSLIQAQNAFLNSLNLCESLKKKVNHQELMDMKARLLLNIGVTSEHLGNFDKAISYIHKAIHICKDQDLYDLLCQCYITEGLLYSSKHNDHSKAIICFNLSLEIASRLDNKIVKQCEILFLKAEALAKISDFQSAKMVLVKAWKMKTTNESEQQDIEKTLKIVAALCYTEDMLVTTNSNDYSKLKKLYEKMGDGACSLKNYQKAVNCYLKMLDCAEKCGDSGKELVPIYISLYQTYKDLLDYERALEYNKMEYELVKINPKEAFSTLMNLADTLQLAGRPYDEIESTLLQARNEARKQSDEKQEAKCLKILIKSQKDLGFEEKALQTENELSLMGRMNDSEESSEDDGYEEASTPNIGDDICLEDLTDLSDNEENDENSKPRSIRKRGKGFTIKKNSKGETQLHSASISGNTLLATRLLSQGHPVNIRDNAGWLPIHEACIHGHKTIVELLIKNGAYVNDRGGTQCDGITPIYDAASNGHLEIVELLLNNGASPSIKSDYGDTPLDVLKKWRKNTTIDPAEIIFYETIYARLHKSLEHIRDSPNKKNVPQNKSPLKQSLATPKKKGSNTEVLSSLRRNIENPDIVDDPMTWSKRCELPSNSETESEGLNSPILKQKSRRIIDDSSNSSDSSNLNILPRKESNSGVNAYRDAINALRNKQSSVDASPSKCKENQKKSALLSPDEVGEDWLENDVFQSRSKKRRQDSCVYNPSKRKSNESVKSIDKNSPNSGFNEINNFNNSETNSVASLNASLLIDSDNSCDDMQFIQQENVPPGSLLSNCINNDRTVFKKKSLKKWKHQSSLLRAGFSRKKTDKLKAHSTSLVLNDNGSDTDSGSNISLCSNRSKQGKAQFIEEPDSTTEYSSTFSTIDKLAHFRNSPKKDLSVNMNMNTFASTAAMKVRVEDKLLLIPVMMDRIDTLTINWLIQETSRRYYNIEGVQPTLHLLTNDGAILADEDPLSIVLGPNELQANIISWNLPPLGDRYIECCTQYNNEIDNHIKYLLETSQATHTLDLSNMNLAQIELKPIFKALNHQSSLKNLILSNNIISNDGLKMLNQCLPTLNNIISINLSSAFIEYEGLQDLLNVFEKSTRPLCPYLEELNLSFNSLNDLGFTCISKLTNRIKLKSLNIRACDIDCQSMNSIESLNLCYIQNLDISYNLFKNEFIEKILRSMNPEILVVLKMEGLNICSDTILQFLNSGSFSNLKEIDISRCRLTDVDVTQILRCASKCINFEKIHLRYNKDLTFLSLKKLLQYEKFTHLDLEGCSNIFKHVQSTDLHSNWFTVKEGKLENLIVTSDNSTAELEEILKSFSSMWHNYCNHSSSVKIYSFNQIIFKKK